MLSAEANVPDHWPEGIVTLVLYELVKSMWGQPFNKFVWTLCGNDASIIFYLDYDPESIDNIIELGGKVY